MRLLRCFLIVFACNGGLLVFGCDLLRYYGWAVQQIGKLGRNYDEPCQALSGGGHISQHKYGVKLFVFQRDEIELLSDWLQYHSHLFGLENIHIIDHSSSDPQICKLLALYQACGVNITIHSAAFELKQRTLTTVMRDAGPDNFLVPLDADEFIALPTRQPNSKHIRGFQIEPAAVRAAFEHLPVDGRKYKFGNVFPVKYDKHHCDKALWSNYTRRALNDGIIDHPQYQPHHTKTFYYSEGFLYTDQGNHYGAVVHDQGHTNANPLVLANISRYFAVSELVLLHFSVSTYAAMRTKMLRGAAAYNYSDASNCSTAGIGKHYCAVAKIFQPGGVQSRSMYVRECLHRRDHSHNSSQSGGVVHVDRFSDWFRRHALSLLDLVGI